MSFLHLFSGKTCPEGMSLVYGKCIGVVANTESNDGSHSNCNWNSDSLNYRLAVFGNINVKENSIHIFLQMLLIKNFYRVD